jgi:ABC-type nitrate/sulfonate/bicarbonate transport system substrate-binding protein
MRTNDMQRNHMQTNAKALLRLSMKSSVMATLIAVATVLSIATLVTGCGSDRPQADRVERQGSANGKSSQSVSVQQSESSHESAARQQTAQDQTPLRVAIAPYQDVGMLVAEKDLGLEKKYGTKLELITLAWEDIPNAIASAGQTVDVGFVGLTDYMSKIEKLNSHESDPIIYLYPALLFRGGGFVSFNDKVPVINGKTVNESNLVAAFLDYKIGAQKTSCFQMVIYMLARKAGVKPSKLHIIDTTLNDGLLAAMNGSLDMAAAGLPQRTEAIKRHGRVVLSIDTMDVGEINGFACKQSTYTKRKKDIENLIRMWFDCTNYITSDPEHHSAAVLAYLKKNASTQYSVAEYKRTIAEEYFPKSVAEAEKELVSSAGQFSLEHQADQISDYLVESGAAKSHIPAPKPIKMPP